MKLYQKRAIQSGNKGKMVNTSNALVAQEPKNLIVSDQLNKHAHVCESIVEEELVDLDSKDEEYGDLYTFKEIDNLNNKIMAYNARKFKNLRFSKSRLFNAKTSFNNYNKGGSSKNNEGAKKRWI